MLKTAQRPEADGACFAAFVANTWEKPVHLQVSYAGQVLPVAAFTAIPMGQGKAVAYGPDDDVAGLPVGQVAVLFLSRNDKGGFWWSRARWACTRSAWRRGRAGHGLGSAFHITSDVPVVAYQMDPDGGGQAGVTSATPPRR